MLFRRRHQDDDILACPRCDSRLVQPLATRRRRDGGWQVARQCPECGWRGAGRFSAEAYADFECAQHAARAGIEALLARIERARLHSDADVFLDGFGRRPAGPDHI